jgi:type VI secretion system protein ImpA
MLNLEELLAPIAHARPAGEDLAFSPELDAVNRARQADDPSIDQGAWVTALKEADWKFVAKQCASLIAQRSKDLQLAVWLIEASAKTGGLRGLADGVFLLADLCDRFWDDLYPTLEDGTEQRVGNLCWIAARAPQLILEMPVTEDGAFSMHRVEGATAAGAEVIAALDAARRRSSRPFYASLLSDGELCEAALARLEQVVDARLADDGPGFTAARNALQTVLHFVRPLAADPAAAKPVGAPVAAAQVAVAPDGSTHSRAQALAQLRAVADFFRRTEPHSPVAYLADKAVRWSEMPLHEWLRAVVKDGGSLSHLEEMLGVQAPGRN